MHRIICNFFCFSQLKLLGTKFEEIEMFHITVAKSNSFFQIIEIQFVAPIFGLLVDKTVTRITYVM